MSDHQPARRLGRGPLPVILCGVLTTAVAAGVAADSPATSSPVGAVRDEGDAKPPGHESAALDDRLRRALAPVAKAPEGRLSVAVQDLGSGRTGIYGDQLFDTASIVKVNILAALLLQAQDEERPLSDGERTRATRMIERSDNEDATALWRGIGGAQGLERANERLGLTETRGGAKGTWGLTRTTARDQMALLRAIYADHRSALEPSAQQYLRRLMGEVVPSQDWGVSAAADNGRFQLKNGWLPRSTTDRWDVNSIGALRANGHDYLVVVLSDGHQKLADGIPQVERAARAAVAAVTGAAGD